MFKRFRRLRSSENLRALVRENALSVDDFIYPLFVVNGKGVKREISSMPGVFQLSIDELLKECKVLEALKIKAIILFGVLSDDKKDDVGSDALSDNGIIATALRAIKSEFPNLLVIIDLCFCEYTSHGHCGIINKGCVDNDATLEISAQQALIHARNGADMIAPSGMMDGIITTLRGVLDENGFENLPLMAYSTKFASAYYGPFRDIADSTPSFGDRKSYQMDFANGREALAESLEDEAQGADILMVKPALAYLDVVAKLAKSTLLPICVYNVSGEYALLKAGAKCGVIDYERVLMETMLAFKRAGARLIISYHAKEVAEILAKNG